jgi:hypothetical protein
MNPTNKNTWCINAFHSLSAGTGGDTRPCCAYKSLNKKKDLVLGVDPLEEHLNKPEIIQLQKDLSNGIKHPGCRRCWQEEDAGHESKRIRDNKKYTGNEQGLVFFDMALGNQCNIRCRTCGPHASSQWIKEAFSTKYFKIASEEEYLKEVRKFSKSYEDDSPFWNDLEQRLEGIRILEFYGGEPLLSKKMWRILEICVEKGYAKNIEVHYATNGTLWPKQVELWKHFKHVDLAFSIDGLGEQFEYLRYMAQWSVFMENFKKALTFSPNVRLHWCVTVSNLNVYYLDSIIREYHENYAKEGEFTKEGAGLYINILHAPKYFNIDIMPEEIKKQVINKLNKIPSRYSHAWRQLPGIIRFMENGTPDSTEWDNFFKELRSTDTYRNQDFAETFPEFANLIGYKK